MSGLLRAPGNAGDAPQRCASLISDATEPFRKREPIDAFQPHLNSMADTEKLIQAVYSYPVLYNVSLHSYRRSERRAKACRKVAASIGLSVVECKLRNEEDGHHLHYWTHRETLSFLDAHMRKRKRRGGEEGPEDVSRSCQQLPKEQNPIDTNAPLLAASPAYFNGKIEEQEIVRSIDKPALDRVLDEDELFLLSYVPALKRLTPQKRAAVKMKIQQIMFDAEFKDE
ncbi:uncharacterized protein [Misgurnus anguillicaudatus]|uniref:uncharacterized protein n=1 Tax=Misgurnus anguillicaudatus TaxID=75329 RepID=UPI003CCF4BAD